MNKSFFFFAKTITPMSVFLDLMKVANEIVLPNPSLSLLRDHNPVVGTDGKPCEPKAIWDYPISSTRISLTVVVS